VRALAGADIVPVSANAVSLAEYSIAYILPFIVGAAIVRAPASNARR